jgi:hypothetical protein
MFKMQSQIVVRELRSLFETINRRMVLKGRLEPEDISFYTISLACLSTMAIQRDVCGLQNRISLSGNARIKRMADYTAVVMLQHDDGQVITP